MKLRWTPLATEHLKQVHQYIAQENLAAAWQVIKTIRKLTHNLLVYPQLGRQGRVEGTRELIILGTSYFVVYRIEETTVDILSVLHQGRRWP